jgi:GNAT superfamily N-acetyltransferase
MEIRELHGPDALHAYPVWCELRPHLDEAAFSAVLREAPGYRIVGAFVEGRCVGALGGRVLLDFVHGRHFYVDDRIVRESERSKGIGARLFAFAEALGRNERCVSVRLSTGVENAGARRFYEREQWRRRSVVYKKPFSP